MIKINQKIKAFTLTEIMVVIVLSAIVAGLAFSVLEVVQKNLRVIEGNYAYQSRIQALEVALTIDFNNYTNAEWKPKEESLLLSSPIEQKKYRFLTDSIITSTHTHILKIKSKTFYYEGKEVKSGRIDAIKLTFDKTSKLHRIFVFKYNDPTIHF